VNTSRILLDDLIAAVMALIRNDWSSSGGGVGAAGRRVLTLAREMGTGESGFGPTLAGRLDLSLYDRDLLEQEAVRLGVSRAELARIDEQPAGIFQRFRPGSLHQRYFVTLGQLMSELAAQGDVLIVGRGGSRFLRDDPRAFHVRLVAPLAVRVRRTMEYRWLAEAPARALIAETDAQRDRFYADFFGADRSDPLEYCITVNGGRLGAAAVDLVAFAAERFWARPESAATPPPNPACPLHPGDS
jgi:cytidylate kinase